MRRFICFFLVCSIFIFSIIPASASENDVLFNVLDLGPSINGTNYSETTSRTLDIKYNFPFKLNYNYVDVVFTVTDTNFTLPSSYTLVRLGSNLYRAYGHLSGTKTNSITFKCTYSSNSTSIRRLEIISYYVAIGSKSFIHTGLLGNLACTVGSESGSHNMTSADDSFTFELLPTVEGTPNQTTGAIYINDWQGYDYIDISVNLYLASLSFINCYISNTAVKYEVSYLTHEDLITDTAPNVTGYSNESHFYVFNVRVYLDDIDRTNTDPLIFYFEGFITGTGYFTTEHITGYVPTGSTSTLGIIIADFKNFLTDLFDGTEDYVDDFQDSAVDQSNRLDYAESEIQQIEKPNLGDMDFDVSQMVDPNVLTLSTSGISTALSNNILVKVLIMALTMALAGFILYGKK